MQYTESDLLFVVIHVGQESKELEPSWNQFSWSRVSSVKINVDGRWVFPSMSHLFSFSILWECRKLTAHVKPQHENPLHFISQALCTTPADTTMLFLYTGVLSLAWTSFYAVFVEDPPNENVVLLFSPLSVAEVLQLDFILRPTLDDAVFWGPTCVWVPSP